MCRLLGPEGLGLGGEWTRCETPRVRGSRDRPAEPRYPGKASLSRESLVFLVEPHYPGTAHCFFAQEPVEAEGGNVSGTMQGHPDSTRLVGTPFP